MVLLNPTNSVAALMGALLPPGPRSMRQAIYCDICLWTADKLRHRSREHPMPLMSAMLKELVLGLASCRNVVMF